MGSITNDIQQTAKISYGSNDYTINILPDKVQIDSRQGLVVMNAQIISTEKQTEWIDEASDYTVCVVKMLKNVRRDIYERLERDEHSIDGLEDKIDDYIRKTDPRIDTLFTKVTEINDKIVVFVRMVENKFSEVNGKIDALEALIDISGDEIKSLIDQIKEIKQDIAFIEDKSSYLEKRLRWVENKSKELEGRTSTLENTTKDLTQKTQDLTNKTNTLEKRVQQNTSDIALLRSDQKRQDDDRARLWADQARQDAEIHQVKQTQIAQQVAINENTKVIVDHEERITVLEKQPQPGPVPPIPPGPFTPFPAIWHEHLSKNRTQLNYKSFTDKWRAAEIYWVDKWVIVLQEEERNMSDYIWAVVDDLLSRMENEKLWRKARGGEDFWPKRKITYDTPNVCMRLAVAYHELIYGLRKDFKKDSRWPGVSCVGEKLVELWRKVVLRTINSRLCGKHMSIDDLVYWHKKYIELKKESDVIRQQYM